MDIIVDSLFYFMYFLKCVNFAFSVLALSLTQRLFSEMYMKRVYALEEYPPSLNTFIGLFVMIHSAFNLFIIVVLMMLLFMFKTPGNNFFVNWHLIMTYLQDYLMVMATVVIISMIIASIIQKKKYFRYKTEGLRAIRGFKEMMFFVSCVIFVIPFFYFIA